QTLIKSLRVIFIRVCKIAGNGLGLCVRAGFGAQNCQPALNLNRRTKLQVCTSPRLTQNPCYASFFSSFYIHSFLTVTPFFSSLSFKSSHVLSLNVPAG